MKNFRKIESKAVVVFMSLFLVSCTSTNFNIGDIQNSGSEPEYTNENYGYTIELPEGFVAHTEGYDNVSTSETVENEIWFGPEGSEFWTEGFYVRVLNVGLGEAYNEGLSVVESHCVDLPDPSDCTPLAYEEGEVNIGGVNAEYFIYGSEIGYEVRKYYFEVNGFVYEIQVLENSSAIDSIESMYFIMKSDKFEGEEDSK